MKSEAKEIWTSALLGAAALIALICWLKFQPQLPDVDPTEKIGEKLFENFTDPSRMKRIQIAQINPDTGELQKLTLVRDEDEETWRLPDASNFPAENAERVSKIIAPLLQLSVLNVVNEDAKSTDLIQTEKLHKECGLLNPLTFESAIEVDEIGKSESGKNLAQGSGLSIKIDGANGETLVDMIVGKRVPESSATRDNRFVRMTNDNVVFIVDFSGDSTQDVGTTEFTEYPNRFSFNPMDWVDDDLLRISRWDVVHLITRDYRFTLAKTNGKFDTLDVRQNGSAVFKQSPENSLSRVWSVIGIMKPDKDGSIKPVKISNQEKVDSEKLSELANLACSLKIVDVRKKTPALISCFNNLRFGIEMTNQSSVLGEFGFSFFDHDPLNPEQIEPLLVGEGGSIELQTKNGGDIVLVFGKKFENKRVCLAYAKFDVNLLKEALDDEVEAEYQAPEARQKTTLKNERLAQWFYLISEEQFQKLNFSISNYVVDDSPVTE